MDTAPASCNAICVSTVYPFAISTYVILTHLHFDHCGGSTRLDRDGNIIPSFPNARYLVQRTAWEEAFNPNERAIPVYGHGIEHLKVLEERGMIDFLDGDTEVTPGVHAIVTDGYSSGHMIVTVNAGSERVVYLSDLIPTPNHLPPALHHGVRSLPRTDPQGQERDARKGRTGGLADGLLARVYRAGWLPQARQERSVAQSRDLLKRSSANQADITILSTKRGRPTGAAPFSRPAYCLKSHRLGQQHALFDTHDFHSFRDVIG